MPNSRELKSVYLFREPLAITIFLMGLAIALFSPLDILDRLPWIRNISTPLSDVFSPISWYSKKSAFPQVAEVYFTLMWLLSPLTFYWIGKDFDLIEKENPTVWGLEKVSIGRGIAIALLIFIILPVITYFLWFINHGYDYIWLPINSSRFSLGIGGYLVAGTVGWWMLQFEVRIIRAISKEFKRRHSLHAKKLQTNCVQTD